MMMMEMMMAYESEKKVGICFLEARLHTKEALWDILRRRSRDFESVPGSAEPTRRRRIYRNINQCGEAYLHSGGDKDFSAGGYIYSAFIVSAIQFSLFIFIK